MPESEGHATLVNLIKSWVFAEHGTNPGLCVLSDTGASKASDKPRRIGGFVPDVYVVTVPSSFTLIGEAKWFNDLDTAHTRLQLFAFLNFLKNMPHPELVIAVPIVLAGHARSISQNARLRNAALQVPIRILSKNGFENLE